MGTSLTSLMVVGSSGPGQTPLNKHCKCETKLNHMIRIPLNKNGVQNGDVIFFL